MSGATGNGGGDGARPGEGFQLRRPSPRGVRRAFVVMLGLALVAFGANWIAQRRAASPAPVPLPPSADSTGGGVRSVRLWFAAADGDSLVGEVREIVEPAGLHEKVARLVEELDRGPRGNGVPALPAGTSVLRVYLDDRGLMTLDLSGAFLQGFHGGSTGEYLAVASLVRTLGANLPEVKRVMLVCASRPVASLGGHLPLDRPLDVTDWP